MVLRDMLDQSCTSVADPTQCHAVAIDGRAPKYDGGIVTRLECVPFSVVVNRDAERFYGEGGCVWPKRYAIWGRLVAAQPDEVGYAIINAKSIDLSTPSVFPPGQDYTIEELAAEIGLDPTRPGLSGRVRHDDRDRLRSRRRSGGRRQCHLTPSRCRRSS
ncbi:hypothetical protein DEA8626_02806 [Defluviimonas aquaemixtae]|uniref:Uncharacterized protein n=1 Tax=Albidovulum aquaemixtae TaxID=1542388 RepID=A0A2R8BK21_9RHOB|nr:hypothetical protein [Defluviimonas aquaemixtae]SPH23737.1 hypothetical protein DEA8626_02806 [Defluviimonas aquaemixtae]